MAKFSVFNCCPVCGLECEHNDKYENIHKCPDNVLRGIEAANTRLAEPIIRDKTYSQRLADGFEMLDEE